MSSVSRLPNASTYCTICHRSEHRSPRKDGGPHGHRTQKARENSKHIVRSLNRGGVKLVPETTSLPDVATIWLRLATVYLVTHVAGSSKQTLNKKRRLLDHFFAHYQDAYGLVSERLYGPSARPADTARIAPSGRYTMTDIEELQQEDGD